MGVVIAAALAAAPAAPAADRSTSIDLRTKGSIRVVWHGDRARGCAAAGLCAYSGVTSYPLGRSLAFLDIDRFGHDLYVSGIVSGRGRTTTRVVRAVAGARPGVCREHRSFDELTLDGGPAYRGRNSVSLGTSTDPAPFPPGRCAGPRLEDFAGSLPSTTFNRRRLSRRGARLSFAGRFPFAAGAFRGVVVSTLVLHTRHARTVTVREQPPGHERKRRLVTVDMRYTVRSATGEAAADFRAVESPLCHMLDSCGTSGAESYAPGAPGGSLYVFASAPTKAHHAPPLRRALAMALRHGTVDGFGELGAAGETRSVTVRPGAATCKDSLRPPTTALALESRRRHRHRHLRLILAPSNLVVNESGSDPLDGRCPGPTQPDVLGHAPLGRAQLTIDRLTRRTLHAVIGGHRRFRTKAYRGTERTRIALDLVRSHVSVRIERSLFDPSIGRGGSAVVIATTGAARR